MLRVGFVFIVLTCGGLVAAAGLLRLQKVDARAEPAVQLNDARTADSDLEVRGVGRHGPQFVTRAALEALPQVEAIARRDESYTEAPAEGMKVRGVPLEVLEKALGIERGAMAVEGVCSDGYNSPFPADYVVQHQPIVVLTVEGMRPKAWAERTHTSDLGPYFVAYKHFVPAFRVLSHEDRPQVPVQMMRLDFAPEKQMFAGILPAWTTDSTVSQGYRIAQQNCFRCHNAAGYGGTKAGRDWKVLGKDARERPEWFSKWVHDPQSIDAKAQMPPNPQYDRATLAALTRYFSSMK